MTARKTFILIVVAVIVIFAYFTLPLLIQADPDRDGLNSKEEKELGTDPSDPDTDNDGLNDGNEVDIGTSPVDFDSDNDGLSDGDEISRGTDPIDIDSDNDGLTDGFEVSSFNTNPLDHDTDRDLLSDKDEQNHQTNPSKSDTDDDGISDYDEIVRGSNPLIPDVSGMIKLIDSETNIPISNVQVYFDGNNVGVSTYEGTFNVPYLSIGQHRIRITVPAYGDLDVGYFNVEMGIEFYEVFIDMPNPRLTMAASINEYFAGFDKRGDITIEIGNTGDVPSEDTMVLITVYNKDNPSVLDRRLVRIGSIAKGEMIQKVVEKVDFAWIDSEYVLVILFDSNRYLPDRELGTFVETTDSVINKLVKETINYIKEHPEIIGKIITALLNIT